MLGRWVNNITSVLSKYKYTRETAAFGGITLALRGSAAFGGGKKRKEKLVLSAPQMVLRGAMRIPNMCLVLRLDNGKVVSIADEQTDKPTHYSIYILIPYWVALSVCQSLCLIVRYRNHFPDFQFQN